MIVVGGVVPPQDYEALKKAGAEAIFPPGTVIAEAAEDLLRKLARASAIDARRRNKSAVVAISRRFCCPALAAAVVFLWSHSREAKSENRDLSARQPYVEVEVIVAKELLEPIRSSTTSSSPKARNYGERNREKTPPARWRRQKDFLPRHCALFDRGYRLQAAAGQYVSVLIDQWQYHRRRAPQPARRIRCLWDQRAQPPRGMQTLFLETAKNGPTMTALARSS